MKALKIILGVFFGVIALLAVGVGIFIATFDVNRYKDYLTSYVQQATGRTLTIGGPIDLTWRPLPSITLREVAFSNADWSEQKQMMTAKEISVTASIVSLWQMEFVLNRVHVRDATLWLEVNRNGVSNWTLQQPSRAETPAAAPSDQASGGAMDLSRLPDVQLESVSLRYNNRQTDAKAEIDILEFSLNENSAAIGFSLDARYKNTVLQGQGDVGRPLLLGNGGGPVNLKMAIAEANLTINGKIDEIQTLRGLDINLAFQSPNLDELQLLTEQEIPSTPPLRLNAQVQSAKQGQYVFNNLDAQLGESRVTGLATIITEGARPKITGKLNSPLLRMADLSLNEEENTPPQPRTGQQSSGQGGGQTQENLFSKEPLPFDSLKAADADLELQVQKLVMQDNAEYGPLSSRLQLNAGRLQVNNFSLPLWGGVMQGNFTVDARAGRPTVAIASRLPNFDLAKMLAQEGGESPVIGKADLDIDVRGAGTSVAAIMASLNGQANLVHQNGRINRTFADFLSADLFTALTARGDTQNLTCAIARFTITDGVAQPRMLLADTPRMLVVGVGQINLGTERINMLLRPKAKNQGLANLAVPVTVTGPLTNPSYAAQPAALTRGVTGILSQGIDNPRGLLGALLAPQAANANICADALQGKMPDLGEADAQQQQPPVQVPERLQREIDRGLRRLFGN